MSLRRLLWCSLLLLFGSALPTGGQSIFTIAGGADLDGRPALAFPLTTVIDVAIDREGNLYISDADAFRIRKVTASTGLISTVAGNGTKGSAGDGGPATAAAMSPLGVAVDSAGNVFIVDGEFFNESVRRVDARTGIITTVAGGGHSLGDDIPATERGLGTPEDIAIDSTGNLYIAAYEGILFVSATTGRIRAIAGAQSGGMGDGGPATAAEMYFVRDVAIDERAGKMYIADYWNNRVRRVDLASGIIDTIAGGGASFSGDGVPATSVSLIDVGAVAVDASGNVYVAENLMNRVRRIDTATGLIWNHAGTGPAGFSGDDGPGTNAALNSPTGLTTDAAGNVYIADSENGRVRRVDSTGTITTVAGVGTDQGFQFVGDGGPGTAATLFTSLTGSLFAFNGVALDESGTLYIADTDNHRIRRLDLASGVITTVAGNGREGTPRAGSLAIETSTRWPGGTAVDPHGNVYFADTGAVYRIDAVSGVLNVYAGGGSGGDGEPATQASVSDAAGIAFDRAGNLFISQTGGNRVRRVDGATGIITTYAGNGTHGSQGDGGPATLASLAWPKGVAVGDNGNLYIAEDSGDVVRKVDGISGIITTVAGNGWPFYEGDGMPATEAGMGGCTGVGIDAQGNVYFTEEGGSRLHRIDASTGILRTMSGQREEIYDFLPTFAGDNGPATAASLGKPEGLAVSPEGDVYIADTNSNRVRVIYRCRDIVGPLLVSPADGSSGLSLSPRLQWSPVPGAFRYDVYLGTTPSPSTKIGSDLESTAISISNLEPIRTYYWRVVAKGDPFCVPFRTAQSDVRSFTTAGECARPGEFVVTSSSD